MKIEVGKSYRTRDGQKIIITQHDKGDVSLPFGGDGEWFSAEGRFWPSGGQDDLDLVAEWVEPVAYDAEGWIEWKGGKCPVDVKSKVQIKLENGSEHTHRADFVKWERAGGPFRTVAYRPLNPQGAAEVTDKHAHYFHDVRHLDKIDIYRMIELLQITSPSLAHSFKKIAAAGKRGAKNQEQDVQEAIDSLERWKQMRAEDQKQ